MSKETEKSSGGVQEDKERWVEAIYHQYTKKEHTVFHPKESTGFRILTFRWQSNFQIEVLWFHWETELELRWEISTRERYKFDSYVFRWNN